MADMSSPPQPDEVTAPSVDVPHIIAPLATVAEVAIETPVSTPVTPKSPKKLGRPLSAVELQYYTVKEKSFGCLTEDNFLRRACLFLTRSQWFEYFILVCVLTNVCILGAFNPFDTDNTGARNQVNDVSEPIFTAIFTFEFVVKIIALDIWGQPNGYFNDGWNCLDAFIVLLCYIQLTPGMGNVQSIRTVRLMRVMRTLRSLRAFKAAKFLRGLQSVEVAMNTVAAVVPQIVNAGCVLLFVLVAFGMFALMLFSGVTSGVCTYPYNTATGSALHWSTTPCGVDCNGPYAPETCTVTTGDGCPNMWMPNYAGGVTSITSMAGVCRPGPNPDLGMTSFDNVGVSVLTWYVITTLEGWSGVMYNLWHTFGAPVFISFFFIGFITIASFFLLNMFTAAFISNYSEVARATREKARRDEARARELGGVDDVAPIVDTPNAAMGKDSTDDTVFSVVNPLRIEPSGRVLIGKKAAAARPTSAQSSPPSGPTRSFADVLCGCFPAVPTVISSPLKAVTSHWSFTSLMTLVIIANAILLACDAAGTSADYDNSLNIANLVFVVIFTAEMVLKLLALGFRGYTRVPFNLFDGAIVIISIIEAVIVYTAPDLLQGGGTSALRAFRLLRVLKLAKSWRRLNKILNAISAGVAPGCAALLVMGIMMFAFALMGMQLFGGQYDAAIAAGDLPASRYPRANFDNLWWALVTSFWAMTAENWNTMLYDHMSAFGIEAFLFFVALVAVGNYIFANMYLAILLDGAGPAAQAAAAAASEDDDSVEQVHGGLPAVALGVLRRVIRFVGDECRARMPNNAKSCGYCPCDCLEDGPADGSKAKSPLAGSDKWPVPTVTKKPAPAHGSKPSGPAELMPVAPAATARVDIIHQHGASGPTSAGAVLYIPATLDPRPAKGPFEDPDDLFTRPPGAAAGMKVQVLASGDVRVIPQAPERLPCDAPLVRKKQLETGELVSTEAENKRRDAGGRAGRKWRAGHSKLSQTMIAVLGKPRYESLMACGRACGLVTSHDENDVLAQIPVEQLASEAEAANVKLDLNIRKPYTPQNLRRPSPHESLSCILYDSPIRMWALRLTSHPAWERLTMLIILLSTINLALAEPWTDSCDPDIDANCSRMTKYLYGTDVFITLYFCLELALKVIAQGLYFDDHAYLRDPWNALDCAIVIVSIISLSVDSGPVRALRAFRALRAMRPLRMVSRMPGLKLVVNTLLQSLPKVCEVCLVSFLFMFIFAIIGVQNFKGGIAVCNDASVAAPSACTGTFVPTGAACALWPTMQQQEACYSGALTTQSFPREWTSLPRNYDDIGNALLTVWELGTAEDWTQRMLEAVDSNGEGKAMSTNANQAAALYFIVVQIVIAWTCFSFFAVIVFDTYTDLKSNAQGSRLLTTTQRSWVDNMRLILVQTPRPSMRPPPGVRAAVYTLVKSAYFEAFIMLMIIGNVVALACSHFGMSSSWNSSIEYANYAFTLVFTLEAVLKTVGLGWKQYIRSPWHKFDFFLVIAAIISAAVSINASVNGTKLAGTPIATLLRILRISRLFRVVKSSKGLQRILRALVFSIPAMGNVFGILALLWFIFAIVGMQIFSGVRYGDWAQFAYREGQSRPWLNADANFDSFPIAFMTVFRISTGDDFNGIMHDLMVDVPYCDPNGTDNNCGDKVLPPLFFIACHFITYFIACKLFLVVVADAYNAAVDTESTTSLVFKLTRERASQFRKAWVTVDTAATGFINAKSMPTLLQRVDAPLGLKGSPDCNAAGAKALMSHLRVVPDTKGMCQIHAVLHALVAHASKDTTCGAPLAAVAVWGSSTAKSAGLSLAELASIVSIQAVWRGSRARKQLKKAAGLIQNALPPAAVLPPAVALPPTEALPPAAAPPPAEALPPAAAPPPAQ